MHELYSLREISFQRNYVVDNINTLLLNVYKYAKGKENKEKKTHIQLKDVTIYSYIAGTYIIVLYFKRRNKIFFNHIP